MDKALSNINLVIIRSNINKPEFKIWKIIFTQTKDGHFTVWLFVD